MTSVRNIVFVMMLQSVWVSISRRATGSAPTASYYSTAVRAFSAIPSSSTPTTTRPISTSTTTTTSTTSDQSAFSKSRAPFRMPKKSPDDSKQVRIPTAADTTATTSASSASSASSSSLAWNQLGLWTELTDCLTQDMQLEAPTAVQQFVLPELLLLNKNQQPQPKNQQPNPSTTTTTTTTAVIPMPQHHHVAFLAATGSGKTLAYVLPLMQWLKHEEVFVQTLHQNTTNASFRPTGRPRAMVLAPTRELAYQIKSVLKLLTHRIKLSVQCVVGGEKMGPQQKLLQTRPVDILVATPGRLWKHMQADNIVLNQRHLRFVVLDEMDTMLEQGFAADLQQILYPVLFHNTRHPTPEDLVPGAPSVWMTSATMTQAIQKMMGDDSTNNNNDPTATAVHAKRHFVKRDTTTNAESVQQAAPNNRLLGQRLPSSQQQQQHHQDRPIMVLPKMKVLKAPGLHKTVPRLQQVFVDTANVDKLSLLTDLLSSSHNSHNRKQQLQSRSSSKSDKIDNTPKTMVFCNTAAACRAVEYALNEARIGGNPDESAGCLSYHGDMPSDKRMDHLRQFRENPQRNILVCTDLAARGLDVPAVDHVVMFDFPLNSLDYLHRCGRTARGVAQAGKSAKVTALVTKRDKVLANAIERAVVRGEALDGLSSRKTDYLPGGRLDGFHNKNYNYKTKTPFSSASSTGKSARSSRSSGGSGSSRSSGGSGSSLNKKKTTMTKGRTPKPKPVDTTARKRRSSMR